MSVRRAVGVLLLAGLLALSGCAAISGGQSSVEDPPGVENGVLQDVPELVGAHNETLSEEGFVFNDTFYDYNGSRVAVTPNYDRFVQTYPSDQYPDSWANETTVLNQISADESPAGEEGHIVYQRNSSDLNETVITRAHYFDRYLDWGEYNRTGTTDCGENRCVVLQADEPNASSPDVENVTASATVAPSGAIHEFNASGTWNMDASPDLRRFDFEYQLVELGNVSVEKPEWVVAYLETRRG